MDSGKLSRIERMAIGAYAAPISRSSCSGRRIKVTDKDGSVVREISVDDLNIKIRERAGIEFDVFHDPEKCTTCGLPSTEISKANARNKGVNSYCELHKNGKKPIPICCFPRCRNKASKDSWGAAKRTPGRRWYCLDHSRGGRKSFKCRECGVPCGYGKKLCEDHRRSPKLERCAVCGGEATPESSRASRYRGNKAYCKEHKGFAFKKRFKPLPCSWSGCGNMVMEQGCRNARKLGITPMCRSHAQARSWANPKGYRAEHRRPVRPETVQ